MTNDKIQMTNEFQITNSKITKQKYDLEERTLTFSKNCISLCKILVRDPINRELICQLVRSASSIGSNYREANDSLTKKAFHHLIGICRRESKESKYWLELLLHSEPNFTDKIMPLISEAHQLAKIFATIGKKTRLNF